MHLRATSPNQLAAQVMIAHRAREKISTVDLTALNQILEHHPEDLTVTVQTGMSLQTLQEQLGKFGQWLPLDPPFPERTSIADLLAHNATGPRRWGFGTARDYLIGLKVILADGRLIQSGGKVVKNVAGYDLARLFIGSHGSLGITVEATFKLLPRPAKEIFLVRDVPISEWKPLSETISSLPVNPSVFDLEGQSTPATRIARMIVGFSGTDDEVQWQARQLEGLGFSRGFDLSYARQFFERHPDCKMASVLPSRLSEHLDSVPGPFLARAGNGIYYSPGSLPRLEPSGPAALSKRLKEVFDPNGLFPEISRLP